MFSRGRWTVVGLIALVCLLVGVRTATTLFTPATAKASGRVTMHQVPGVLAGLSRATFLKAAPANDTMQIGVGIAPANQAAENKMAQAVYDKSSPDYHHFLTVSQFHTEFGVDPVTTQAVKSYLLNGGLKITYASSGGDYFIASGTVAQLDNLFDVKIGQYKFQGKDLLANNVAPSVPTTLPITGIAGLDTVQKFVPAALKGHKLTAAQLLEAKLRKLALTSHKSAAQKSELKRIGEVLQASGSLASQPAQDGDQLDYTPQDLWGIYNMPGASELTNANGTSTPSAIENSKYALGQGQTIGIFMEGETSSVVDQLRLFEEAEGLPKVPVRTIETEGPQDNSYSDNTGAIEWYLDSQSSTGIAPDVKQLDFFTAKDFEDADIFADFDDWANDPTGPEEMNASFGECEENPTNVLTGGVLDDLPIPYGTGLGDDLEAIGEPVLEQATLEGRTLFAAAGDTGSGCDELVLPVIGAGNGVAVQPVPIVSYPCASAYAVCVGGTVVSSPGTTYPQAAQRTAETSWTYGGGGTSYFIPAPSWQDGITNIDHDCVSTPDGTTIYTAGVNAPLCRGVPDVADLSGDEDGDGYFIYIDGAPSSEGGTSLASPLMVGQWARIQSAAPASVQQNGGLGFADPLIYQQAASADKCTAAPCTGSYANDFFDVTASEDVGDTTGIVGAGVPTGIGIGNGAYQDGPGWDYASGWGSLNVSNFMMDVDHSIDATDSYTGPEAAPFDVCEETGYSPSGNATDPETDLSNDSGLDLTQATLSSTASKITATWTVPDISAGVPVDGTSDSFTTYWKYDGTEYSATATESLGGTFSYSDSAGGTPTGSVNTTTGLITVTLPTSDSGNPPVGGLLTDVQSLATLTTADILPATADSADNLRGYSVDDGDADSIGVDVVVGGVPGSTCDATLPSTAAPSGSTTTTVTTPGGTTTVTEPGTTITTPGTTITTPGTTITEPGTTITEPGSTTTTPGKTVTEPGKTTTEPGKTVTTGPKVCTRKTPLKIVQRFKAGVHAVKLRVYVNGKRVKVKIKGKNTKHEVILLARPHKALFTVDIVSTENTGTIVSHIVQYSGCSVSYSSFTSFRPSRSSHKEAARGPARGRRDAF